jgi:hypothetical protein
LILQQEPTPEQSVSKFSEDDDTDLQIETVEDFDDLTGVKQIERYSMREEPEINP